MYRWILALLILAAPALAQPTTQLCFYGDNRGSSKVHRAILRQANRAGIRHFVIAGDVLKYDYGYAGSPEAVLEDYRQIFAVPQNDMVMWPETPGPTVFVAPGGHDEEYFLASEVAAMADSTAEGRYAYEGNPELGTRLYETFSLDLMRLRAQPFTEIGLPLPMSPFGDYLVITGAGPRRDCALLVLYRTDRWGFREEQIRWVDSTLKDLRALSPTLPLIAVAHDWMWLMPDSLDDGSSDGAKNSVRVGSAENDREQKRALFVLLEKYGVDLAIACDLHAYWAEINGDLLRMNCAAARCFDPNGQCVAIDNVWLEYSQTPTTLRVKTHVIEPPAGCGLQPEAAEAYGTEFIKNRATGAVWRKIKP